MTCVIIDDEELAVKGMTSLIETYCKQLEIVGSAFNVDSAVNLINKEMPELIFLDINLADGLGFEVLKSMEDYSVKVIIVSAHNNYCKEVFELNVIDFILKPLSIEKVVNAVQKAMLDSSPANSADNFRKFIPITNEKGIEYVKIKKIQYLKGDYGYTEIYFENRKIVSSKRLSYFESILNKSFFFRVHQSYIINIENVERLDHQDSVLVLNSEVEIPLSRSRRKSFIGLMNAK